MIYEYMIVFMSKNGYGRIGINLKEPITSAKQLEELDLAIRENINQDIEKEEDKDNTAFVVDFKLLKSYNPNV